MIGKIHASLAFLTLQENMKHEMQLRICGARINNPKASDV